MTAASANGTGARRVVRRALERAGLEHSAGRAYQALQHARSGPTAWRNAQEDRRVRLLAAAVLSEGSSCIDVGAHNGTLLETFVDLAPAGHHIAYEPVPRVAHELAERFPGVEVRTAAAADEGGESTFVVHTELPTRSSLRPVGYSSGETETISVPVERLDEALPDGFRPALLKIDVEGAEHLVLRGALETLRAHRPLVLFEHQQSTASHYGSSSDEIFDLLAGEAGMRLFDMDGRGPYSRERLRDVVARGSRWNFFASGGPGP